MTDPDSPRRGIKIARISGIPIYVGGGTLIFSLLLTWLLLGSWVDIAPGHTRPAYLVSVLVAVVLFLVSLLLHELAHSITAKSRGVEVESITLWLLGGVSIFLTPIRTAGATFLISVVGPLASLALGVLFYLLYFLAIHLGAPDLLVIIPSYLAAVNVALAVFNMLPGAPLDGGHVLRAVLWKITSNKRRAIMISAVVGQVIGAAFVIYAVLSMLLWRDFSAVWFVLIGWFMISAATTEYSMARRGEEI